VAAFFANKMFFLDFFGLVVSVMQEMQTKLISA